MQFRFLLRHYSPQRTLLFIIKNVVMNKIYTILFLSLFFSSWSSAQIFTEDFDGSNTSATTTTTGCGEGDNDDYFGITDETVINQDYTGDNGSFLGAQDTNGADCSGTGIDPVSASIAGIDISGQTGLILCFKIAEGTAGDSDEDWDASSNVTISVQIDGGAAETLFVAEASVAGNSAPGVDCGGNGVGDGPAITEVFTEYCIDISGTGLSLDINIDIAGLDAGDEDVALDDFTVYSNEDAGVPTGADPCPECDVTLDTESYTCISNTIGDNNDMVTVNIPYIGVDAGITSLTTTSGGTVAGDNPASITDGTIMITGLMEGDSWDIVLNGGDCDGDLVSGTIPVAECDPACMDPIASGSCTMDIQMDLATVAEATDAPNGFHNTIMDCPAGFEYIAAYGEVSDEGDGNNSTGNINGLFDESGNAVSASYEVGHVDTGCSGNGLTSTLTGNSTISTGGTLQAGSPKPTSLFSTHYTENTGSGGLNALKIDFTTPVNNFGIFLGDWESSTQGTLGEIWAFDAAGNLICNDVMDPVLYGPISDESGCGAAQGEMNCGNETTTWIGITNPSTPIGCVLLVLGDDDSCAVTADCDGLSEHISFGGVTVGGECSEILPIELLSIDARPNNNNIDINWSTASEINNDFFDIQWSRNGINFQTIEGIKGSGTSYSRNDYTYTHLTPSNGKNYYRIKQVDFDGQSSYTKIVLATIEIKNKIRVFPTVVNDQIRISLSETEGLIAIYNINGSLVKSINVNTSNLIILNVADLPAGSYIVSFINDQQTINDRFIKI